MSSSGGEYRDLMTRAAGQISIALLSNLKPVLDEQLASIISDMKNHYRTGKVNDQLLVSYVAQLCVLEDLENSLRAKINQARNLQEELLK